MAVVRVQQDTDEQTTATQVSGVFPSNVTAGNLIVVEVRYLTAGSTPAISDTLLHTYTLAVSRSHTGTGTQTVRVYYAWNISGGANTVLVNGLASGRCAIVVREYSGLDATTDPMETAVSAEGTGTSASPGAVALSGAGLICSCAAGITSSFNANFTIDSDYSTNAVELDTGRIGSGYRIHNANDTPAHTIGSTDWVSTGVSFLEDASSIGTAAVTGTVVSAPPDESDIVGGGKTIIITLTGDSWVVAAGSAFDNQRQNIIDGIAGTGGDTTDQLISGIAVTDVVRTSDTVVTITLPAIPGYDIASTATYEVTVPSSATQLDAGAIVATPTFNVTHISAGGSIVPILASYGDY